MALVEHQPAAATLDDLDDVLDVNISANELFRPLGGLSNSNNNSKGVNNLHNTNTNNTSSPPPSSSSNKRPPPPSEELGLINSEVQVSKKRRPVAKLDETRLLSAAGLPKLRQLMTAPRTAAALKRSRRGHEFEDIARLLNVYQLWLDDLFPRAKFADGLAIIEKLGHSKRMAVLRREWMREGESCASIGSAKNVNGRRDGEDDSAGQAQIRGDDQEESLFVGGDGGGGGGAGNGDGDDMGLPDDDELDGLLADVPIRLTKSAGAAPRELSIPPDEDIPQAEEFDDRYAEEMRMMADMEDWS